MQVVTSHVNVAVKNINALTSEVYVVEKYQRTCLRNYVVDNINPPTLEVYMSLTLEVHMSLTSKTKQKNKNYGCDHFQLSIFWKLILIIILV